MEKVLMVMTIVLTIYFVALAIAKALGWQFGLFTVKAAVCTSLGVALGGLISMPLFNISNEAGYVGMGLGLATMYILFYSGVIKALINLIPANIRRVIRTIFNVIRIVLIVAVIILAVVSILKYFL